MNGHLCRWLRPALLWALALGLLSLAWHLKHPLFYALRPWETPLLLIAGLAGGSLALLKRPAGAGRRLLGVALLAVAGLTIYREVEFMQQRAAVLAADADMRQLGGHFIVGFEQFADLDALAGRGLIGGIYLTRRNVRGQSFAAVAGQIARLQEIRRQAGLPPLIVAADQEGGPVSHLSPLLAALPPLAELATGPAASRHQRARLYGERQGDGLARLGVNLNFGPVVDLRPASALPGDRWSNIAARAIAAHPAIVGAVAAGYIDGLSASGVRATLKHFPGLGRVRQDTHLRPAKLREPPAALAADWQPFRSLAGQPNAAIMLGHVTLSAIDNRHAASHSAAVVDGLLRRQWAYDGILLTDDLNMGAVYQLGIARVASEALAAGVDLLLVSYDPEQYFRALYGAAQALRRGDISVEKLAASRVRLEKFSPPTVRAGDQRSKA